MPNAPQPTDAIETARQILTTCGTWAVVGCSPDPYRASNGVAKFLMANGYRVIPVNPAYDELLGQTCYPDVRSIPVPVDCVDVFRRSELAGVHVDEAIDVSATAVWLQLGVVDEAAARRARAAGLLVVMDRCPQIDRPRLLPSR
ncbi:MAG TPA: CoA-binding protein [Mycobacteriales bacterium]|nr:CoA-binding protein [Mycobacteriales bacterium]